MIASLIEEDSDWFPVKVKLYDDSLKLMAPESEICLGTASSRESLAICRIATRNRLTLRGTLVVPAARRQRQYLRATLRLVLYGHISDEEAVGKALSDNDLYLQHPSLTECDGRVPYFNPQYLLRPGASMPELENLMISGQEKSRRQAGDPLDEVERSRLLQIFESAHDPNATFGIHQSSRLQSTLKECVACRLFTRYSSDLVPDTKSVLSP